MPRITQQIMIMIFFCSGVPASAAREERGDCEFGGLQTESSRLHSASFLFPRGRI